MLWVTLSRLLIMCSKIFPGNGNKAFGRQSFAFLGVATFGSGMIVPSFHAVGKVERVSDPLYIFRVIFSCDLKHLL